VLRLGERGNPYIAYADDCDSCFLCQLECPHGAVQVSAEIDLSWLPY
jgi:NAD-dependent dihydropyrimidine dehydrogenase PreA subunit